MEQYDVIVVGGGLAGVCAAERALAAGATVALITKGWLGGVGVRGAGASGCGTTEGGVPAYFRLFDDSFDADRYRDMIINAGLGVVEREMVTLFVEEFVRMKTEAGKMMDRYHQPGPYSLGTPLVHSFLDNVRGRAKICDHATVAELLVKENACHGALCVDETTADTFSMYGKAVVLAAGGDAGLFAVNVHPECVCGDGYALGLKAGAEAVNLEFMQIFSMTTAPTRNLIHFWKEEYLSSLYNSDQAEFLPAYLPAHLSVRQCIRENILHAPFSVRDEASRYLALGIVGEIRAGRGTASGGIYVDLRDCASFLNSRQDHFFRYRGIDASTQPVEVSMGFQCCNGGLRVDRRMETSVEGLFAAGENAGGLHGADRLGGNMLAGCIISGRIAGEQAARRSQERGSIEKPRHRKKASLLGKPDSQKLYSRLITRIRRSAWDNLLVVKSETSVGRFQSIIDQSSVQARGLAGDPAAVPVELDNLIILGRALAKAAGERCESRGGFFREDHPNAVAGQPAVHRVRISEAGEAVVRKEVVDPLWDPTFQDPLNKERWG